MKDEIAPARTFRAALAVGEGGPGTEPAPASMSTARRGCLTIVDVDIDGSGAELVVVVELSGAAGTEAEVGVRALGRVRRETVVVPDDGSTLVRATLGPADAARWSPEAPVLHDALVEVLVDGAAAAVRRLRFGLRTIALDGPRLLLDGRPLTLRGAVVPARPADVGAAIDEALGLGFNALVLPPDVDVEAYLEVCDRSGVPAVCTVPRGVDPSECVRRHRGHPSLVLWSLESPTGDVVGVDPTRPAIAAADPARAASAGAVRAIEAPAGGVAGHALEVLERRLAQMPADAPVFVQAPVRTVPPPVDPVTVTAAGAPTAGAWPGPPVALVRGAARREALAERLRIEAVRRRSACGYASRVLVGAIPSPAAFEPADGLESGAAAELVAANQALLPMLASPTLRGPAGRTLRGRLVISNDAGPRQGVRVLVTLADAAVEVPVGALPAHALWSGVDLELPLPVVRGTHELELRVLADDGEPATNRYPIHVVPGPATAASTSLIGSGATAAALERLGAQAADGRVTVVAEGALDADAGRTVRDRLEDGGRVLVLAQRVDAAPHYPLALECRSAGANADPVVFTTDEGAVPSLPRRRVLVHEDVGLEPDVLLAGPSVDAATVVVGALEPGPPPRRGVAVAEARVGAGRLVVCQLRLAEPAAAGDPVALAVLADLLRWVGREGAGMLREQERKDDGRSITYFTFPDHPTGARDE